MSIWRMNSSPSPASLRVRPNCPNMWPTCPPTAAGTAMVREELRAGLPTTPENMEGALPLDVDFWVDNLEELNRHFNTWIGQ